MNKINETNYFNEKESFNKLEEIKKMYSQILSCKEECNGQQKMKSLITDLLKFQKEDGSFSVIESYRCDGDIRVEYAYMPTFYATAAMIYVDLHSIGGLNKDHKVALKNGLHFAIGRQLVGHGFDATETLIKTLRIYAEAGMYQWIQKYPETAGEFKRVVDGHYTDFVKCLLDGTTCSDWNRDFSEEFKQEVAEYEMYNTAYVWYAAYGSNINMERFMKYINRCTDTTAPVENMPYIFSNTMYFGGKSRVWGGAVAYLDPVKAGRTYGRIYKITKQQFEEIQQMEGSSYNKKETLGYVNDIPVYTFTSDSRQARRMMPSYDYLATIYEGLKETYPNKEKQSLWFYLYTRGFLTEVELAVLEFIRESEHAKTVQELIHETYITKTCMTKSIKELHRCGLIVQDSRSAGVDITDPNAMVYTNKEMRELIDVLIMMD